MAARIPTDKDGNATAIVPDAQRGDSETVAFAAATDDSQPVASPGAATDRCLWWRRGRNEAQRPQFNPGFFKEASRSRCKPDVSSPLMDYCLDG